MRASKFAQQIASRDLGFGQASRDLYQLLLEPAAAELRGACTVIVAPDGVLWRVPFQALARPVSAPSVLALPSGELPDAVEEVGALQRIYGAARVQTNRGAAAGEAVFKAEASTQSFIWPPKAFGRIATRCTRT